MLGVSNCITDRVRFAIPQAPEWQCIGKSDRRRDVAALVAQFQAYLSKPGWTWGCVSALDSNGRTIWIADAHSRDGKRFIVRADEN